MRLIIFSDSHGADAKLRLALDRNIGAGLDGMIFLGDGLSGVKRVAEEYRLALYAVAGNCDFSVDITRMSTYEQCCDFGEVTVLLMHGHRYSVKSGTGAALKRAQTLGAKVLLYGHTHVREDSFVRVDEESSGIHLFNPGSISLPKDGIYSFGLMEIRGKDVLLSHGQV